MIIRPLVCVPLVFAALASATPASAAPVEQGARPASEERICEKITVTGSRLATRKICATRAEWAERRRQDRETTEGFQTMRNNPCNSSNQPNTSTGNC